MEAAESLVNAQQEFEALRRVFTTLDTNGDGFVSERDITESLQRFGYKPKKGEVADMIWEVDEDSDGHISWPEFQEMFTRCRSDKVPQSWCMFAV